jgi:hypothetical protein
MLTSFHRMAIQDVHLLIAQARLEADNPTFKVYPRPPYNLKLLSPYAGLFPPICLHWSEVTLSMIEHSLSLKRELGYVLQWSQ